MMCVRLHDVRIALVLLACMMHGALAGNCLSHRATRKLLK